MEDRVCDEACEILRATADGEGLDPTHLYVLQEAVNGNLSEKGWEAFRTILAQVRSPEGYKKPWLHGIEHMTRSHSGNIYWKGTVVEHFTFIGEDGYAREKAAAEMLATQCREIEARGETPNLQTIWDWKPGVTEPEVNCDSQNSGKNVG